MMELKPCPFCGKEETTFEEGSTFRWRILCCAKCGANCGEVRVQTLGEGTKEQWEKDAYQAAVIAWNTRYTPPTEWRDISSAPKDGTDILVSDGRHIATAAWWKSEQSYWNEDAGGAWITYVSKVSEPEVYFQPTHWQPLPLPPTQPDTNEEEV